MPQPFIELPLSAGQSARRREVDSMVRKLTMARPQRLEQAAWPRMD